MNQVVSEAEIKQGAVSLKQKRSLKKPVALLAGIAIVAAAGWYANYWWQTGRWQQTTDRYSAADVAAAIGNILGRPVTAEATPRAQWEESLGRIMKPGTVGLMTELYDVHNSGLIDVEPNVGEIRHGTTELIDALRPLLAMR